MTTFAPRWVRPGSTTSRSWRPASATRTWAPACCDAIFHRRVYHHLSDPAATNASLYAALKPGGRLAIIELEFGGLFGFLRAWPHWTDDEQVVAEVTAAGFTHVATADWPVAAHYAAVFLK